MNVYIHTYLNIDILYNFKLTSHCILFNITMSKCLSVCVFNIYATNSLTCMNIFSGNTLKCDYVQIPSNQCA